MENLTQEQTSKTAKPHQTFWEWVRALALALIIALFITQVVVINAQVPSESMENTILVGDRLIGFRLAYLFNGPKRGDIIIFRFPDDESKLFVKRVVGLPGETVQIRDGQVYINGAVTPTEFPHVKGTPTGNYGPYKVPENSYFVMGDNRNDSLDSRYWVNTFVSRDKILAQAVFRLLPNPRVLE